MKTIVFMNHRIKQRRPRLPVIRAVRDGRVAEANTFWIKQVAMGADARRAVEIACRFGIGCGRGVDVVRFS